MFLVIFGILICILLLYVLIKTMNQKSKHTNNCILPITALVVDVDVVHAEDLGKMGDGLWYLPTLRINLNGKDVDLKPSVHSDLRKFVLGDNVPIVINPANPREFYYNDGITRDYKAKAIEFGELVKSQLKN